MPGFVPIATQPVAGLKPNLTPAPATFTVTGQATVAGVGKALDSAIFSVTGQATVAGAGFDPNRTTASASGHATVAGVGLAKSFSTFAASGHATVAAAAIEGIQSEFSASGHATVAGVSYSLASATFDVTGQATVAGIPLQRKYATFGVTGVATVAGVAGGGDLIKVGGVLREALVNIPPPVKVGGMAREVLLDIPPPVKVAFTAREVLLDIPPPVKVGGIAREALLAIPPPAKVAGVVREILYEGPETISATFAVKGFATVNGIPLPYTVIPSDFPPLKNTSVQNVIPAYVYVEYNDDDDVQSIFATQNAYAQAYFDYLNTLELPVYTNGTISGTLLDWVNSWLYGFPRPGLPSAGKPSRGPFNTYCFNQYPITFNGHVPGTPETYIQTSDDIYKRCLTWLFFKGDGFQFDTRWLKRRVMRFLNGINGVNYPIDETYPVSVTYTATRAATISIPTGPVAKIFKAAVDAGVLTLPFNITWTVDLV